MSLFYGEDKTIMDLLKEKKNFILIGEAGSGKAGGGEECAMRCHEYCPCLVAFGNESGCIINNDNYSQY